MSDWTILGASDLILDIIDAIIQGQQDPFTIQIVLNMPIRDSILNDIKKFKVIQLEDYNETWNNHIFGFTDPNKDAFLAKLSPKTYWSNVIHCKANCSIYADFGKGNYFAAGSTIASNVFLKYHNFVNRNASIGHHTQVDSFNHFGPGSIVCGRCVIGSKNFFGAGSIVKDKIRIGNNVTIGAGAVVVNDILESGVYIGIPAKRVEFKNP